MKGILLKDLYCIRGYLKQMGFMLIIMFVLGITMNNPSIIGFYAVFIGLSLLASTMSVDEKSGWEKCALTYPISRTDMVKEKYLLLILLGGISEAAALILNLVITLLPNGPTVMEAIASAFVVFVIYMYAFCIYVPAIYKMGTEKARYIFIAILMIPLLIIVTITGFFPELFDKEISDSFVFMISAAACILAAVCLYLSYKVSLKIYLNKEF